MSTRSMIGIRNHGGTIEAIYCHYDGYPDGVGRTLIEHYGNLERARALVAMGDLSAVAENLEPEHGAILSESGDFPGVTQRLSRESTRDLRIFENDAAFLSHARKNCSAEFVYVYDVPWGRWFAGCFWSLDGMDDPSRLRPWPEFYGLYQAAMITQEAEMETRE